MAFLFYESFFIFPCFSLKLRVQSSYFCPVSYLFCFPSPFCNLRVLSVSHYGPFLFLFSGIFFMAASFITLLISSQRLSGSRFLASNVLNPLPMACLYSSSFDLICLWSLDLCNLTLVVAIKSSWSDLQSAAGIVFETFMALFHLCVPKM